MYGWGQICSPYTENIELSADDVVDVVDVADVVSLLVARGSGFWVGSNISKSFSFAYNQ